MPGKEMLRTGVMLVMLMRDDANMEEINNIDADKI